MSNRLNPTMVKLQLSNLLLQFPELETDAKLLADMVEGSTDTLEFLSQVERKRQASDEIRRGLREYIAEHRERLARLDRADEAFRKLHLDIMEHAHLQKAVRPEATLSICAGKPKVIITDEDVIPDSFCRIKREPDKEKIKDSLLHGDKIQGAELSNAEPYIAIRTR